MRARNRQPPRQPPIAYLRQCKPIPPKGQGEDVNLAMVATLIGRGHGFPRNLRCSRTLRVCLCALGLSRKTEIRSGRLDNCRPTPYISAHTRTGACHDAGFGFKLRNAFEHASFSHFQRHAADTCRRYIYVHDGLLFYQVSGGGPSPDLN